MIFLKIFLALVTLPLLFVITFVNTENVFQNNFGEIYTMIYGIYFIVSALWLIVFKYLKIKNNTIKQELLSSLQFIFYTCVFIIPAVWLVHYFILWTLWGTGLYLRSYGKVAFIYLVLALSISPIKSFIKNKKTWNILILIRKILWILSFVFFLKHGLEYFSMEYLFSIKHDPVISYLDYVWKNIIIRRDALSWVVAWILMLVLWITSNKFSMTILSWNTRKRVQSLAYPAFLITSIHIAFASRFDSFYIFLVLFLVFIRTLSYISTKDKQISWTTTKYVCVPCGYIYDEVVWDPDWWLEPWTKFEDIPDWRVCPVCGLSKNSFEPYYDSTDTVFNWYLSRVVDYVMLTKDVLELSLKLDSNIDVLPWQYILLCLKDFDWEFTRSYSVVEKKWNIIKLWIKIKEIWRWGRTLKKLKIGDLLKVKGVYWKFVLKKTSRPKVFVATWTWLSPLFNMIHNTSFGNIMLLRWLTTSEDIFYLEKFKEFKNLKIEIFLSKEQVSWYHYGRVNTDLYKFSLDTEFYLCWNSIMVTEQTNLLKSRWYENVYSEVF